MLSKLYHQIDVANTVAVDEPTDDLGFLGINKYYRKHTGQLRHISEEDFLSLVYRDNKLKEIMLSIKEIDRDHNGYVTRSELDDILKMHYEKELSDCDLAPLIDKFCSISNKILIDYK